MSEWTPNEQTGEMIYDFLQTLFWRLPYIMGIDEWLNDCEVVNLDPEAAGLGTYPRQITVTIKRYHQLVTYRGIPGLAVGDVVTVAHYRQGDLYEVIGAGGSGGSSTVPPPLLGGYSRGAIFRGGVTAWEPYQVEGNGDAIVGNGVDVTSRPDPTWAGLHTFLSGLNSDDDIVIDQDNKALKLGGGGDMDIGYDGADGYLRTDLIAASDLNVDCGANKTIELQSTVWDDQQVTIGRVRTGASAPTWTLYKSSEILAFHWNQDNMIYFDLQYTHRLKQGTNIEFHIHNTVPDNTAGDVRWVLTVSFADITGVFPAATTYTAVQTIAINSLDTHLYFEISNNIGSSTGVSGIALCSLMREGTHITDTYANWAYLVGLDAHIEIDTQGSRQETIK